MAEFERSSRSRKKRKGMRSGARPLLLTGDYKMFLIGRRDAADCDELRAIWSTYPSTAGMAIAPSTLSRRHEKREREGNVKENPAERFFFFF